MRKHARTDANHMEIVKALRKAGCKVLDLSRLGNGVPDLLVKSHRGLLHLIEIKTARGRLTDDQQRFVDEWSAVFVVCSVQEALEVTVL